ncbi:G patch domain-containing protein 11 [Strongylocentrotus purpuratus]|uniref:G patch domain-containing protein 11 n=1 Tax=Strongylocentrotus purpuratus TaxID=7668 RepID=A0A7M7RAB3_STRPU|nr:G patch domain-containing protein 11 [Strongylocentrotus purpuratus]
MAEGEEDDYMSDSFLVESKETKPRQLAWGKTARLNKMHAKIKATTEKNKSKFIPMKVREEEQRQKGLNSAISTQSKGFAMLQKMGYKQGTGLGKTGSGRAEPVGIEIKTGRGGLGQEKELKRKQEEMAKMREVMAHKRAKMAVHRKGNFLQQMSERFSEKEVQKDLYNSQKACAHLDHVQGLSEPEVIWYWPKKMLPEDEVENEEEEEEEEEKEEEEQEEEKEKEADELSNSDKLSELTQYLRTQHRYCVWCGTAFNDDKDLEENCPGNNADVHR